MSLDSKNPSHEKNDVETSFISSSHPMSKGITTHDRTTDRKLGSINNGSARQAISTPGSTDPGPESLKESDTGSLGYSAPGPKSLVESDKGSTGSSAPDPESLEESDTGSSGSSAPDPESLKESDTGSSRSSAPDPESLEESDTGSTRSSTPGLESLEESDKGSSGYSSPGPESLEESESGSDSGKPPLSRQQKITLLSLMLSCVLDNASFSILLPFFPIQAANKGVSTTVTGFIFGIYALVQFISSPIFGKYVPVVGAKFMFLSGLFVTGGSNLLFGVLGKLPDGKEFIIWCFVVRSFEALGAAAGMTALYTTVARTFPDRVAQMIGIIETTAGVGIMLGPPVGGILYQVGGYQLPFMCLGVAVILSVILNIFLLPPQGIQQDETGSLRGVLCIFPIWPVLISLFVSSTAIGFLDPTLSTHLHEFNLSPTVIGMFFFIGSGVYSFMSPFCGYLADSKDMTRTMMVLGFAITGVGYLLLGPSGLLKLPNELWIVGLGLGLLGLGWACSTVPPFQDMLLTAVWYGMPDNLQTQGIISGLYMSTYSLGCFAGPSMAGIMIDQFGFNRSSTIFAGACFAVTIGLGLFSSWEFQCGYGRRKPKRHLTSDLKDDEEEVEPLLPGNKHSMTL